MSATTGTTTACRPRPNGSMPPAPEQPSHMPDVWMKSAGMQVIRRMKPIPWEKRNRMGGASMTCREMFANWSPTGMREIITAAARLRIRPGLPQANNVVSQAGVVADFADSWARAASPTAHSKAAQADDAVAAGDLAEAAVNFR